MKQTKVEFPLPHEVRIQYVRPIFKSMIYVNRSWIACKTIRSFIGDTNLDYKEHFWIMLLSRANRLLGISHISTGSTSGTVVSTREILQCAILTNACGVILVHNHPSGQLEFSQADLNLTQNVREALRHMDIQLLDHLILTTEDFISMSDENIIEKHFAE